MYLGLEGDFCRFDGGVGGAWTGLLVLSVLSGRGGSVGFSATLQFVFGLFFLFLHLLFP